MIGAHRSATPAMRWLLGGLAAAGLLERARAQDNSQPTAAELACWQAGNGGFFYDGTTCTACTAGRYDHDAIINMPHMNMDFNTGQITWWDGTTDYNPAVTACQDCEAGKFAPFTETTHMCYPCGAGQYSPGGPNLVGPAVDCGTTSTGSCAAGCTDTGSVCTGVSTELTYVGCSACDAGQSDHDSDAATPCVACAAGTFARAQGNGCRDCPAGFVDEDSNPMTECTFCQAGYYSAGSDDAAYTGSNPEVYALVCDICAAGTADLDGGFDGNGGVSGYCATGTVLDTHDPGDYVDVASQVDCHGSCSLAILLPTHDQTEMECLALGSCSVTLDGVTADSDPAVCATGDACTQAECEGIRPTPGTWTSAGGVWTASTLPDSDVNRWHTPFCSMEDGTYVDVVETACTENDGTAPGLFWHPEVFRSAATPCVSCVPGRYQQAGEITCLQCEAGFTTDSLSASGGT